MQRRSRSIRDRRTVFLGRIDDQVKVGGRRIELGEVDAALVALPGVVGAAAAAKTTASGNRLLVGYLVAEPGLEPPLYTAAVDGPLAGHAARAARALADDRR